MKTTDSIQVRHTSPADAEQLRALYAEPTNYASTLQLPFPSFETWEERLRKLPEGTYSLVACRDAEILGHLGIQIAQKMRRRHVAMFGIAVKTTAHRKGVGSKLVEAAVEMCDKWLNIRRLEIEVYTDNEAAIGLYRKFGFEVEGTMRQYAFRDGQYVDAYAMARITKP